MRRPRCLYLVLFASAVLLVSYVTLLRSQAWTHGYAGPTDQSPTTEDQIQTFDGWPVFSKNYFPGPIPKSPFYPKFRVNWDYNTTDFLQRPDVQFQRPKIMTWMVKTRYMPHLPEPVRLRFCPEMPCRMTTNRQYQADSAALLWAGQIMRNEAPPLRSHPDQVFVFHNHEPQSPDWRNLPSFRKPAWKSAFNWTMTYRFDSDLVDLYGLMVKRDRPLRKNYTQILAKKTKFAAWLVSHCSTYGQREKYVNMMRQYVAVDAYGTCSSLKCPRSEDDSCFNMINESYKFFLSFESEFCKDYISEKLFRYLEADTVVVARGDNTYNQHAPPGTFVNTNDFKTVKDLTNHLLFLDQHPEEYVKVLEAKDRYQPVYEDYPIRDAKGNIGFMHYHYEGVPFCEMCRRLWNLDQHRQVVADIVQWFDKGNCVPPTDLT